MVIHLVLFKLKERSESQVTESIESLRALLGKVPSLKALTVGKDVVQSARSYDFGIIAGFEDLAGLESYRTHSEHVAVAKGLNEICESIAAVDFEENALD